MATVFLLGDSTCAEKRPDVFPETGWGMCFMPYLREGWHVDNRAVNGLSTKQCLADGTFAHLLGDLVVGDYVVIQFGHNEDKDDVERHTEPWTSYSDNLSSMVAKIRRREAFPLFLSSISRRRFLDGKHLVHSLGDYPKAMQTVARTLDVPFVDMTGPTRDVIEKAGPSESKRYFMHFGPGLYPNWPDGLADDTHLRPEGARMVAALLASSLQRLYPDLPFLR